jgi:hypothetical protein
VEVGSRVAEGVVVSVGKLLVGGGVCVADEPSVLEGGTGEAVAVARSSNSNLVEDVASASLQPVISIIMNVIARINLPLIPISAFLSRLT